MPALPGSAARLRFYSFAVLAPAVYRSGDTNDALICRYAASFFLQRSTATPFDMYYEAGRRGRSQADCQQLYLQCNEV